jgi:hypothetical protein
MTYRLLIFSLLLCIALPAHAQADDLVALDITITQEQDAFGQSVQIARGVLFNEGDQAYTNINLTGDVLDDGGESIGEAFGVLVNACGAGLLFDFALQPGAAQPFALTLELAEADLEAAQVNVSALGEAVEPMTSDTTLPDGVTQVSAGEVVAVEWEDEDTLRYAVGCERDLFTQWDWHRYDIPQAQDRPIEHPSADGVTDELRQLLRLDDPLIFANSRLRFAPIGGERLVYQDEVNTVYTAQRDGRLQRLLYNGLNSYSLQGIIWLPENRFMAYYYGALGDDVIYFTSDADSRAISRPPLRSKPSLIVPGVSADGLRAIIGGTFEDGITGYYIDLLAQNFTELLLESELPGNNYPPPVPLLNREGDRVIVVYLFRPIDGENRLQCYYRPLEGENELIDLAPMPFNLADDERAWSFLAPDQRTIALAANGLNGGLWLIDLEALPDCGE